MKKKIVIFYGYSITIIVIFLQLPVCYRIIFFEMHGKTMSLH